MTAGLQRALIRQVTGSGARGVVAAAAPLAAAVGAEALRAGGNAYDAAVTAALAETVLLPPKCGLAGDLIALTFGPGDEAPAALLAIGGAPAGLAAAIGDGLPDTGPLSVGVPGAPAGYAALAHRATADRRALAEPARRLARDGFPWSEICTELTRESQELLRRHNDVPTSYLPDGQPRRPGQLTTLPGLAVVLEEWSVRGAELMYGPVGDVVLDRVRAAGGVLHRSDLAFAASEWTEAASVNLTDHARVWATPAPTHGPSLLDVTQAYSATPSAAELWGIVQASIARRRAELGDPRQSGTSMVSAADAEGNVVVIVHSNSYPHYGSGMVVDELDLILANRAGRGFSTSPDHPNHPRPGQRPATTLHAWAYRDPAGRQTLIGATPGGVNQMPWNAQLLADIIAGESEPGVLVTAPRWGWVVDGDGVQIEDGLDPQVVERLVQDAGWSSQVPAFGLRCAQQVVRRPQPGEAIVAAVDPRTGGSVVGV